MLNNTLNNTFFHNLKPNTSDSRFKRHILKALGGAMVSLGATFSLFLTSAQAASFVTTFETDKGNVTLKWSGEDANSDEVIDGAEMLPQMTVSIGGKTINDNINFFFEFLSKYDLSSERFLLEDSVQFMMEQSRLGIFSDAGTYKIRYTNHTEGVYFDAIMSSQMSIRPEQEERLQAAGQGGLLGERASTPEPTLTLGFITLGGLMLGSKRKSKS